MSDLDALVAHEKSKYEKAYQRLRYRSKSPHWRCKDRILEEMRLLKVQEYANFGCGSGLLDRYLLQQAEGILVDHVQVLWPDVKEHPNLRKFIEASLFTDFEHFDVPFAVCTDVMEHIPPEQVDKVLENIAKRATNCFFQISLNKSGDNDEEKYGGHLHLTVETPEWWEKKLLNWFGKLSNPTLDIQRAQAPWEPDKKWYLATALQSKVK